MYSCTYTRECPEIFEPGKNILETIKFIQTHYGSFISFGSINIYATHIKLIYIFIADISQFNYDKKVIIVLK